MKRLNKYCRKINIFAIIFLYSAFPKPPSINMAEIDIKTDPVPIKPKSDGLSSAMIMELKKVKNLIINWLIKIHLTLFLILDFSVFSFFIVMNY